ncbi:zinc finger CW-type PWWP domain protein 1-like [Denticeps clupeoides]|uniref:zinc finger CW-type PWWP domain protein 1-like n=1 Tax=Denticeps clupeoides TaxID=299321 RepID=UPI0010A2CA93|nr:zinc finger CW-type PWWP domain protein 1 [Denticeps clupeoides]
MDVVVYLNRIDAGSPVSCCVCVFTRPAEALKYHILPVGRWRTVEEEGRNGGQDERMKRMDTTGRQGKAASVTASSSQLSSPTSASGEQLQGSIFIPGSLVWAQQSGHPWWPAVVERDPDTNDFVMFRKESGSCPFKCHVTFLGDPVSRAWVLCSRVRDFADLSAQKALSGARRHVHGQLKAAIQMAGQAKSLYVTRCWTS